MAVVAPPLSSHYPRHHRRPLFTPLAHSVVKLPTSPSPILSKSTPLSASCTSEASQFSLPNEINRLCESQDLAEALSFLQENLNNGVFDSIQKAEAVGALLQACGNEKDLETGRKAYEMICASALLRNNCILNTQLITMYSMCESPVDSRAVFDNLQSRNLYQWNALVSGYTKNGLWCDAVLVFIELIVSAEHRPDNFTFPCVIKACGWLCDVGLGETAHGMAIKMGLAADAYVCNALIAMYGKFGFVSEAAVVFEKMPQRNLVSWNSMISAFSVNGRFLQSFDLFRRMLMGKNVLIPDVATLVSILPVCAEEGEVDMGKQIHTFAVKLGLNEELTVNNSLLDMYSKFGCLDEARILFEKNEFKNVVSWNSMIGGYSREGDVKGTFCLLRDMQILGDGAKVNEITVLNVLPVCSEESELLRVKELQGYSIRHGLESHELLANAFIMAYAKCGSLTSAKHVFYGMESKAVSSWNALIGGHAQNGDPSEAFRLYQKMIGLGFLPDCFTISSLLLACAELKLLQYGKQIHGAVLRTGLETDLSIFVSLLSLYFNCGNPLYAQLLFNRTEYRSSVSWNVMIAGYLQNAQPDEALNLFHKLVSHRVQPDEIAVTSALAACSKLSALQLGKEIHCFALKAKYTDDTLVRCSIMDMYAKCGLIGLSEIVFKHSILKDVASWTVLISGCAVHGLGTKAIKLFQEMQEFGLKPNSCTITAILMACSHAGLIEEGLKYFSEMQTLYSIRPKLEHYSCVVDMLGRAGRFADALNLVNHMPVQPDTGIWSSLLSSCIFHGELDLGKNVAEKLLDLEPSRAETYVLVSNLFAESGNWNDVRRVRRKMKERNLQKDIGCSYIEVGGKFHNFVVGNNILSES